MTPEQLIAEAREVAAGGPERLMRPPLLLQLADALASALQGRDELERLLGDECALKTAAFMREASALQRIESQQRVLDHARAAIHRIAKVVAPEAAASAYTFDGIATAALQRIQEADDKNHRLFEQRVKAELRADRGEQRIQELEQERDAIADAWRKETQ